jgi:hypothetical protein
MHGGGEKKGNKIKEKAGKKERREEMQGEIDL